MPSSATSTPELAALADVCARLDSTRIDYMLTGSLAMSYYARPRMTRDINLVIALDAAQVELLTAALGADYHADGAAITAALREARPWIVIHLASVAKIDLIPRKETPYRLAEFERRSRVELAGVSLWIVSIEDLSSPSSNGRAIRTRNSSGAISASCCWRRMIRYIFTNGPDSSI